MTRENRWTALRMNGMLFASGVLLMGGLAALGAVLPGPPAPPEDSLRTARESAHVTRRAWQVAEGCEHEAGR